MDGETMLLVEAYRRTVLLKAPHSVLTTIKPPRPAAGSFPNLVILATSGYLRVLYGKARKRRTDVLNIRAVGARAEDGTQDTTACGVSTRKERTNGLTGFMVNIRHHGTRYKAHIVDERYTFDVHVFPVERVLEQLNHVVSDRVFGGETFRPRQNFT